MEYFPKPTQLWHISKTPPPTLADDIVTLMAKLNKNGSTLQKKQRKFIYEEKKLTEQLLIQH